MAPRTKVVLWAVVPLGICLAGWYLYPSTSRDIERTEADERFDRNKALFASIKPADRLVLYEGLPHQLYEGEKLEQEKQRKETVLLHGFPFYRETLNVSAESEVQLRQILSDERSFKQGAGGKECGGFHPDYLAEWKVGGSAYRFLICFGCGEVKVFGPSRSLYCSVEWRADRRLQELLKPLRKNRPEIPFNWRG